MPSSCATIVLMIAHHDAAGTTFAARAITRTGTAKPCVLLTPTSNRDAALALLHTIGASDVWIWGDEADITTLHNRVQALGLLPIDRTVRTAPSVLDSPQTLENLAQRCGVPVGDRTQARTDPIAALDVFGRVWRVYLQTQAQRANLLPDSPDIHHWTDSLSPHQHALLACLRTTRPDWNDAQLALVLLGVEADHRLGPRL